MTSIVVPLTPTARNQNCTECSSPRTKEKAVAKPKPVEKKLRFDEVETLRSFEKTSCKNMTVLPAEREFRVRDYNALDDFGLFWEVDNAISSLSYNVPDQKELEAGFGQRSRKSAEQSNFSQQVLAQDNEDLKFLEVPYGTGFDNPQYYGQENYSYQSYQPAVYPDLGLNENIDEQLEKAFLGELASNLQSTHGREVSRSLTKQETKGNNRKRQRKNERGGTAKEPEVDANSKRRRRCNEWTPEEVVLLLNCTKILVNFELKTISQALFHCIKRNPGKCWGRAAEKKLKRMKIFDNWKTCDKHMVIKRINEELMSFGEKGKYLDPELVAITKRIMAQAEEQNSSCGQVL